MTNTTVGILMAVVAGALNGSFASPTKCLIRWRWENIWALWAVVALFLFPWLLALDTIRKLFALYQSIGTDPLLMLVALGLGFGVAQVFFGLAITVIGIALCFAVTIGISTVFGSLIPLILLQPRAVFTPKGLTILGGVILTLIGIVLCALAGRAKEKELSGRLPVEDEKTVMGYKTGLVLAILAGVGSPLVNFGLAFGQPFLLRAAQYGARQASQANMIWPPLLTASFAPYLLYCAHLWRKNRSFGLYALSGTRHYWILGILMGVLWMGSLAIYGVAATRMAAMGPILGWPLFMSVIIISSNGWGFATGEWRGASGNTVRIMSLGILFLILGFCTLAYSSKLA
jgi:L-rhamnose-H+ transport protein